MAKVTTKSGLKKLHGALVRYNNSAATELYHVYGSFSAAKAKAFDRCKEIVYQYNGRGLKIIGHNGYCFSVGFLFDDEEGNTNFMHITNAYGDNDYGDYFEISEVWCK